MCSVFSEAYGDQRCLELGFFQLKKDLQIETRNKTWQRDDTESLDAMLESPTFNEASLRRPSETRTKITREVFDRQEALAQCPPHLIPVFQNLFKEIDTLELQIQFYEFNHGKRKEEPRASLQKRFDAEELLQAREICKQWNQYKYLKKRHLLVEMRREQFTLRDCYSNQLINHTIPEPETEPTYLDIEVEIPVFPLGLVDTHMGPLLFREMENLIPSSYTTAELEQIVKYYWQKNQQKKAIGALYFDFQELEHVYELFGQLEEIEESIDELPVESNLGKLAKTLQYYIGLTELTEAQKEVLDLKIQKWKNQDIADLVNKKHGKTYTANYISTIFRQKIIPRINETVSLHTLIVENLTFPENFKKCNGCGRTLLADSVYFVRKTRSKDGLSTKCKKCDKEEREKKKVK